MQRLYSPGVPVVFGAPVPAHRTEPQLSIMPKAPAASPPRPDRSEAEVLVDKHERDLPNAGECRSEILDR
ncbi:hypothetical protein OG729_02495 [Streptomyces sp. NBC_00210]|uniref:hypothetical protein n=1 Tax=unclassified Streptomyces TaxID=2593676 RepID=UPI0032465088